MRTTLTIPDDVLQIARTRAAAEGRTVSDVVTEALRVQFARQENPERPPFKLVTFRGEGLPPDAPSIDDNAAFREYMDRMEGSDRPGRFSSF
jgi:hypothetical protein